MTELWIGKRRIGDDAPVYFVADIAANHDGDLDRARELIQLAAAAGADAAKFQNFRADHIVSDRGFRSLGRQLSHQAKWSKSVFEVYADASVPWHWTEVLRDTSREAGIEYFSAPYDLDAVEMLDPYVNAYKVGSGDITWDEILEAIARKGKPVLLSTGASDVGEVQHAVETITRLDPQVCLLQCNTNYTGTADNLAHLHLNVLRTYAAAFPHVVLGLSDHTPGHVAVLGAVALGARVIEKHFTDDPSRTGPDHGFSMDPPAWREMVERTRELEAALGSTRKFVAENEQETVVLQRRCVRARRDLSSGTVLRREDLEMLRPAPIGSIQPRDLPMVIGRTLAIDVPAGEHLVWSHLR